MSQHQIKQGYAPSSASMFRAPPPNGGPSGLYGAPLPRVSAPVVVPPAPGSYVPTRRAPDPPAPPPPPPVQEQRTKDGLRRVEFPSDCLARFVSIAAVNTKRNRETCGLLLGRDAGACFIVTTLLVPKQHATSDTCTMDEEELVLQFTEQRSLITLGWVRRAAPLCGRVYSRADLLRAQIHTHPTQSCESRSCRFWRVP
jgi:STAM-binding protein